MPKIDNYYNRFDESLGYDEILFRDGYGAQGEEQNEQQAIINAKIAKLARALFKDGDVVQGAQIVVDSANGHISALRGMYFSTVLSGLFQLPNSTFPLQAWFRWASVLRKASFPNWKTLACAIRQEAREARASRRVAQEGGRQMGL